MAKQPTPKVKKADPVKEKVVVETAEKPEEKTVDTAKEPTTVKVKNISKSRFTQASSGVTLFPNDSKPLNKDGWLQNQIDAGYLVIV